MVDSKMIDSFCKAVWHFVSKTDDASMLSLAYPKKITPKKEKLYIQTFTATLCTVQ